MINCKCGADCTDLFYQIGVNGAPLCEPCWLKHEKADRRRQKEEADARFAIALANWEKALGLDPRDPVMADAA
jgi:hypothetical protein